MLVMFRLVLCAVCCAVADIGEHIAPIKLDLGCNSNASLEGELKLSKSNHTTARLCFDDEALAKRSLKVKNDSVTPWPLGATIAGLCSTVSRTEDAIYEQVLGLKNNDSVSTNKWASDLPLMNLMNALLMVFLTVNYYALPITKCVCRLMGVHAIGGQRSN